jgi:hypothetical protein
LRNSEIYNNAEEGNVISAGKSVVGGGAYPLRKWLITPYMDNGHLNRQQKNFNKAFSSAHQCVERANAHLKGRFRRLQKVYYCDVKDIEITLPSSALLYISELRNTLAGIMCTTRPAYISIIYQKSIREKLPFCSMLVNGM